MVLDTATVSVHSVTAGRAARAVCTPTCDLTGILTEKNVARGRICTIHGQEAATGDLVGHIPLHIGITAAAKVEAHVQFGCVALQHNIAAGKGVVDIIDGDSRSAAKVNAVIFDRGADMDPAAGNGVVQITVDGHRIAGCMEAFTVHIAACHNEIYIAGQGQIIGCAMVLVNGAAPDFYCGACHTQRTLAVINRAHMGTGANDDLAVQIGAGGDIAVGMV